MSSAYGQAFKQLQILQEWQNIWAPFLPPSSPQGPWCHHTEDRVHQFPVSLFYSSLQCWLFSQNKFQLYEPDKNVSAVRLTLKFPKDSEYLISFPAKSMLTQIHFTYLFILANHLFERLFGPRFVIGSPIPISHIMHSSHTLFHSIYYRL